MLLVIVGAIAGNDKKSPSTATHAAVSTPAPPPEPAVSLHLNAGSYTTTSPNTILSGNVTPGARVTVNGHPAHLHGGFWSASFGLSRGENQVEVQATMAGHTTATESITVTREESSAEHEAKVAAEEQSYKSSATTIPYPELSKDVTRYEGDKVDYEGQVFQIQEEGSEGGWMLVDVTKGEYEIWSNEVYVTFHQRLKATEKSIITFWGEVKGTKSYETKIGGHNEVPEIEAKYVSG